MARQRNSPAAPGRLVAGRPTQAQTAPVRAVRTGPAAATAGILGVTSLVLFLSGFVFVGFYVYSFPGQHLRFLGTGFLTGCAAFVVGCLAGLVVGIPRFVSSGAMRQDMEARRVAARATAAMVSPAATPQPSDPADDAADTADAAATLPLSHAPHDPPEPVSSSQLTFSTNLAEISDWLTKLLLGAGLVELTRLGRPLSTLVNAVARALQDIPDSVKPTQTSVVVASGLLAMYLVLGFLDGYVLTNVWYARYLERLDS